MNVASIEKLAIERADRRTEEVFGLLLSFLTKQELGGMPSIDCSKTTAALSGEAYDLTIDGQTVYNLVSVSLNFSADMKAELTYSFDDEGMWGYESRRECKRIFDWVTTYSVKDYMDICFDKDNYLRIWK